RQAESRAVRLGGDKGLENVDLGGYTLPGIAHFEAIVLVITGGANGEDAALGHRLHSVVNQVQNDLLDLVRVSERHDPLVAKIADNRDSATETQQIRED